MDSKTLKHVSSLVYRQFPEMAGVQPKLRLQKAPENVKTARPNGPTNGPTYLLTYQTKVSLQNGKSMPRYVRVVLNPQGDILKITTSRG